MLNANPKAIDTLLCVGPITLDFARFVAAVDGRVLPLTATEFDLLAYLASHPDRVISQEEFMSKVLQGACAHRTSLIRVHMSHLRRKLGSAAWTIRTVRRRGFLFAPTPDKFLMPSTTRPVR